MTGQDAATIAPIWREARKVQPGWWIRASDGEWYEVRMILTSTFGRKNFVFTDGEQSGYFLPGESLPTLGIHGAKRAGLSS